MELAEEEEQPSQGEEEEAGADEARLREIAVESDDLRALGRAVAANYGLHMRRGLTHAQDYYTKLEPVSMSAEQWRSMAQHAKAGAQQCCPTAAAFFEGLTEGLGWDVYEAMLDFEVYTMELQRQARSKSAPRASSQNSAASSAAKSSKSKSSSRSSSAASSSSSSSSLDADDMSKIGVDAVQEGRCTGFALADGERGRLVAQTADLPQLVYGCGDFDCVLHLKTANGEVLAYDSDGRLCPIGMSMAGLGVAVFNLHLKETEGFSKPSVTVQTLLWELLLMQHSLMSAKAWLQRLQLPMMCGSALLLADGSGAVNVELSAGRPPAFGKVEKTAVRANHALLPATLASFGGNEKARRESARRMRRVAGRLEQKPQPVMGGAEALKLLKSSRKVRNLSTLASVASDLSRKRLHVEFRERQPVLEEEVVKLAKELDLSREKVEKALVSGLVKCDAGRKRLTTGKPGEHFVRWSAHVFAFGEE